MSWWFGEPELLENISDCSICTFVIHTLNYTWHKVCIYLIFLDEMQPFFIYV
jgi:hypothetical protein